MKENNSFKKIALAELDKLLQEKIDILKQSVQVLTEARNNEDKCTVGDKYETGRAMTQMELEKNQAQLSKTEAFRNNLAKINTNNVNDKVEFGSLVLTTQGAYFISIPFGRIIVNETVVFCISHSSPLGKIMAGKTVGDVVNFNGKQVRINLIY